MSTDTTTMRRLSAWVTSLLTLLLLAGAALAETVNINKASPEAMQEHLTGIGPAKSQAIVDYRRKRGAFKSVDDLLQVPGIGQGTLDKIRRNISLNKGVTAASEGFKPRKQGSTAASSSKDKGAKKASRATPDQQKGKAESKSYAGADDSKRKSKDMDTGKEGKAKPEATGKKKEAKKTKSVKQKQGSKKGVSAKGESKDKSKDKSKEKKKSEKKQSTSSKQ